MPPIFVDTDHNPKNKIYDAFRAAGSAVAAENLMQKTVRKIIDKSAGFTTNKVDKPKGYVIRLEIAKLVVADHQTKCTLEGSLVRYPKTLSDKGRKGDTMVSTSWSGSATATGTSEQSLLDCVEAVAESMVARSVPIMKSDITQW